ESTIAIPHNVVTQWHDDMSTYMKNNDPYNHLLTTSVSHREITGLFNVSNLDFVQKHVYNATGTIPSVITDLESRYSKPFVAGEFGYDWDWNNITAANGPNLDFDFKRGLWYGLFSPTPVSAMSWWWEFFDQRGTSDYFKSIQEISDRMLAVGKGNYSSVSATTPSLSLEAYSVKCGNTYFAYVLNNNSSTSSNKTISLTGVTNGTYEIQSYNPEDRTYTSLPNVVVSGNSLSLTISLSAKASVIFIIKPVGDTQGLQSSFKGSPVSLPGILEAEDFDLGGEGIAYHDLEAANLGGQYRNTEGVDIETCSAGGFDVTNTITGEWLEYSVNVEMSGTYTIKAHVATTGADKKLALALDGEQITDPITVSATGGNQNWSVVETTTSIINNGNHILGILIEDGGVNIDKLEFEIVNQAPEISLVSPINGDQFETPSVIALQVNTSDADGSIAKVEYFGNGAKVGESTESPFNVDWSPTQGTFLVYGVATDDKGLSVQSASATIIVKPSQLQQPFPDASSPHVIPGKIEAEDVDSGLDGVAYHDLTPTNIKGSYRTDVDFDIEACSDTNGGFDLADIQATEWVEYSCIVNKTAKYDFTFRVATQMSAQSFSVLINNKTVIASVAVPNTGNWQTWKDVTVKGVSLSEGSAVLKLLFNSEFFNLNYIIISESEIVTAVDRDNTNEMIIYPNPSHSELNLILPSTAREIKIVNAQGQEVYENQTLTEQQLTIMNTYPAGMYIVIVQHKNGSIEYLKALIRP
ncbi:MAG TPA: carbohydrate-binding protein, partial [Cyclobacteriaceae bacterium]|nr:carbohydrate-binding protein [Cyclobacteriaceae bacterium]